MRLVGAFLLLGVVFAVGRLTTSAQNPLPLDAPRPIEAWDSLWAEELTSMEIRDAVRAGTTTIIVGTGGTEQNGPMSWAANTTMFSKLFFHLSRERSAVP